LTVALWSCSKDDHADQDEVIETIDGTISINTDDVSKGTIEGKVETGYDADDLLENSTFSSTVRITYGSSVTIDNPLEGKGVSVAVSGNDVTVTATVSEVAYEINGTTNDGMLKLYSDKKYKLTLNGVSIKNNDGPAINIQSGKRAFIVISGTNTLEDGTTYATSTEDQKGTFFSEGQLIFSGDGTLNITGNNKHALASDDYIRYISGTLNILKAASDGIHANDAILIDGGAFDIKASSDGIEADKGQIIINDGTFNINVVDDGIAASYEDDNTIDPYVIINGGKFNITTTEGEGIESKSSLTFNGGEIYINAYDDAINAGDAIYINGGNIVAYSRTNDGIDSNGILTITGGRVLAIGAGNPETGFDCDNNTFKITGGVIVGVGGATSTPTASVSTQASVILGGASANTVYSLLDNDNNEILTFSSPVSFSTLLLSSGKLATGSNYKIASSTVSNASEFNGLYLSGTLSNVNAIATFTQSSKVTQIGGSTGPGGGGGFGGPGGR
jgi:hypothetical protein